MDFPCARSAWRGEAEAYLPCAGSTGSRVHVYRWVWRGDDVLPTITDDFFKQVTLLLRAARASRALTRWWYVGGV